MKQMQNSNAIPNRIKLLRWPMFEKSVIFYCLPVYPVELVVKESSKSFTLSDN